MIFKTALLVFILFIANLTANAQAFEGQKPEKNVPNIVSASFNSKFGTKDVVWFTHYQGRYDNKLVYEGRFIFDNRYSIAVYNREGNLIAFVANVEYAEVPSKVRDYMKNNFLGRDIVEARLVTRGANDITYEIGVVIDNVYVVKVFTENGDFIRSTRA